MHGLQADGVNGVNNPHNLTLQACFFTLDESTLDKHSKTKDFFVHFSGYLRQAEVRFF